MSRLRNQGIRGLPSPQQGLAQGNQRHSLSVLALFRYPLDEGTEENLSSNRRDRPIHWTRQESAAKTLARSARCFEQIVWPAIKDLETFNGAHLQKVEGLRDERLSFILDAGAGVDYLVIGEGGHPVRALASRVQWTPRPYNTFSIRLERYDGRVTEYPKILEAKSVRGLYPTFRVQSYFDASDGQRSDDLMTVAVTQEDDVLTCMERGIGYRQPNYEDADFWVLQWWNMRKHGFHVDARDLTKPPPVVFAAPAKPVSLPPESPQLALF